MNLAKYKQLGWQFTEGNMGTYFEYKSPRMNNFHGLEEGEISKNNSLDEWEKFHYGQELRKKITNSLKLQEMKAMLKLDDLIQRNELIPTTLNIEFTLSLV